MKNNCKNCIFSHKQFKNLIKNMDGSYKFCFDNKWELAFDYPIICQNIDCFYRFREVEDNFICKDFKGC